MDVNWDEMIHRSTADLTEAEAQLRALQGRVEELRTIREGLMLARQRYGRARTVNVRARQETATLRPRAPLSRSGGSHRC